MNRFASFGLAALLAVGLLALPTVAPTFADEPEVLITLHPVTEEGLARSAGRLLEAREPSPGGFGYRDGVPLSIAGPAADGVATGSNEPTTETFLFPFIVDGGNAAGTTTLLTVTNESELPGPFASAVNFFDAFDNQFHQVVLSQGSGQLNSFNVRDQPGLPGGLQRGYVAIDSDGDALNTVDFYVVTPDQDFASGNLAPRLGDLCNRWRARVLIGGPFTGGTELLFLVNGGLGTDPADPPTVFGTAYNEAGAPVNNFTVRTNAFVFAIDAADLVTPASLFGYLEMTVDSEFGPPFGGFVFTTLGAENRYSVGTPGICRDSVPLPAV